jgi:K+-transporting ATPase ATPase C chain
MLVKLKVPIKLFVYLVILTGIVYPILITGMGQLLFWEKANGSQVEINGHVGGSRLIGQQFINDAYFWPRPSAVDYNPVPSSGSNMGPTNVKLAGLMHDRKATFVESNNLTDSTYIPLEMISSSGSGLDPHISPRAAILQINRIAKARNFNAGQERQLLDLINRMTEKPQFSIFGESRINVFELNLNLDKIK